MLSQKACPSRTGPPDCLVVASCAPHDIHQAVLASLTALLLPCVSSLLIIMATISPACDYNASRVGTVLTAYVVPIPIILLATGLRTVVKLRKANGDKIALDDCLIIFATVGSPRNPVQPAGSATA